MKLNEFFCVSSTKPIVEGGNVFSGKTAGIRREHIKSTLDSYFLELKKLFPKKAGIFNEKHFMPLGSVGKKEISGDIDLGVSATEILDKEMSDNSIKMWGIDPKLVEAEFQSLTKRSRTSSPEQLRMKAFLKELTLSINAHAPNLFCDEKKVSSGNIFGLFPQINEQGQKIGIGVQIDWMVGDLKWLKFSYHSAAYPEASNVKGLHRTQLILAAFQVANVSFSHIDGLKDKSSGHILSKDPDDALGILNKRLGVLITPPDAEDYYKLQTVLKKQMRPEDYNNMINIYLKILDSTRADIPDDLQDEWRLRKNHLGLTGKFLPDTSALRGGI